MFNGELVGDSVEGKHVVVGESNRDDIDDAES